jgi:cyclophilin family peptidyl-prolyl cis-trans isomerase
MIQKTPLVTAVIAIVLGACAAPAAGPTNVKAPDMFKVEMDLSTGPVVIEIDRTAAPAGVDRFYNLVKAKFFDGARFFRVIPGFVVQFGAAASPTVNKTWEVPIKDDAVRHSNGRGTLVFAATSQPNSRTTQLFINLGDNARLDGMGFAPFGRVVSGMENVDKINPEYRENPDQGEIESKGNAYLEKEFPRLDYVKTVKILP